ncbi:MAG TPA: hypothetical protein VM847_12385, partial [Tahibacter sp.]|nr:hypothetical protein [Tahibacter sp.]
MSFLISLALACGLRGSSVVILALCRIRSAFCVLMSVLRIAVAANSGDSQAPIAPAAMPCSSRRRSSP